MTDTNEGPSTTPVQPITDLTFYHHTINVHAPAMSAFKRQVGGRAFLVWFSVILEAIERNQNVVVLTNRELMNLTELGMHEIREAQEILMTAGAIIFHRGHPDKEKHKRRPNRYEINPNFTVDIPTGLVKTILIEDYPLDEMDAPSALQKPANPQYGLTVGRFAEKFGKKLTDVVGWRDEQVENGTPETIVNQALSIAADGDSTSTTNPYKYTRGIIENLLRPDQGSEVQTTSGPDAAAVYDGFVDYQAIVDRRRSEFGTVAPKLPPQPGEMPELLEALLKDLDITQFGLLHNGNARLCRINGTYHLVVPTMQDAEIVKDRLIKTPAFKSAMRRNGIPEGSIEVIYLQRE